MQEITLCPECGVPELFLRQHFWLNNGDIVQRDNPSHRMTFIECENLDPLFKNIGEIIGVPIEHLIINIASRSVESWLAPLIPQEFKDILLSMRPGDAVLRERCHQLIDTLNEANTTIAATGGWGRYEVLGYRYERDENDYSTIRVTNPYSVPMVVGSQAGHIASLIGGEWKIDYKEVSPGVYETMAHWAVFDKGLKERLKVAEYTPRGGDIELERCPSCGTPLAISSFKWYLDQGIIKNPFTGRRMAMGGGSTIEPIFDELEKELGDTIPRTVVEAQRRFVKTGFFSIEEVSNEGDFREHLALRGLGNLREIKMGRAGLRVHIRNSTIHLLVVGLVQGIFEMAFDVNSYVEWELSEEGDLTVEVTPNI
jgi:hypothetical protein